MKSLPIAFAATLFATAALAQTTTPNTMAPNPTIPNTMAPNVVVPSTVAPNTMVPNTAGAAPGATSNAPMAGVNPSTGTTPGTGLVDRNTGTAAASGDRNQAVATTDANAPHPAMGANSFSMREARRHIARHGYAKVVGLHKENGVWRGTGMKDGEQVNVWLDYKGNVGQD